MTVSTLAVDSPAVSAGFISRLGAWLFRLPEQLGRWLILLAQTIHAAWSLYVGRWGYGAALVSKRIITAQIWFTGVQALPLVTGAGLLVAAAMMGLGYTKMAALGFESNFGDLMSLGVLRLLGPLLTALIVVARSCTAITTELANMKLGNEIDAVAAHGINPLAYLAVPRLLGVALANAALTVWMCAAAYLGCFLVAPLMRTVSLPQFLKILADAVSPGDLLRCVSAGLLFGLAIPAVAVYHGMNVPRDINEIPRAGSRAVVASLLVIFALAAALSFAG